jgi:hypothetical protein
MRLTWHGAPAFHSLQASDEVTSFCTSTKAARRTQKCNAYSPRGLGGSAKNTPRGSISPCWCGVEVAALFSILGPRRQEKSDGDLACSRLRWSIHFCSQAGDVPSRPTRRTAGSRNLIARALLRTFPLPPSDIMSSLDHAMCASCRPQGASEPVLAHQVTEEPNL